MNQRSRVGRVMGLRREESSLSATSSPVARSSRDGRDQRQQSGSCCGAALRGELTLSNKQPRGAFQQRQKGSTTVEWVVLWGCAERRAHSQQQAALWRVAAEMEGVNDSRVDRGMGLR